MSEVTIKRLPEEAADGFEMMVSMELKRVCTRSRATSASRPCPTASALLSVISRELRRVDRKAGADYLRALAMFVEARDEAQEAASAAKGEEAFTRLADSAWKAARQQARTEIAKESGGGTA